MNSTSFVAEAIRYQKMASAQIFDLVTLCQSNSEDLLQKTLDQCAWLPANSKESCLNWSASCRETTKFIQDLVDNGFAQAEQVFVASAIVESPEKSPQPKQAAAPSVKTAKPKKAAPARKRKTTKPAEKVTPKAAAAVAGAAKTATPKAQAAEQKPQVSTPKVDVDAPSKSKSAAAKNETAAAAPTAPESSKKSTQASPTPAAAEAKSPETSSTP
jgi:hypothetical protein